MKFMGIYKSQPYFTLSGTSMATPLISGAAPLLLQKNSQMTCDQVKAQLMETACETFPEYTTITDGTSTSWFSTMRSRWAQGYLDLQAAISSQDLLRSL
jgi:subtilisin family serine protease